MATGNVSLWQKHRTAFVVGGVVLLGLVVFLVLHKPTAKKKAAPVNVVNIMPPLPPPPPPTPPPTPPPQEPPPEQKRPEFEPESKPEPAKQPPPPAPNEPPPAPLGTALQGAGDSFGLSGTGNGMIGGTGTGGNGGGASKWGWYAGQVQSRVVQALQQNRKTKSAAMSVKVRIWVDSTGRVTKATLAGSSGDGAIDQAIEREILSGLQLTQPPPDGMPMPIVMRLTARRPN